MYLVSGSHGQTTSFSPGARGLPTEWMAGTKSPFLTISAKALSPMRVLIRMFTTTYGESVISIPRRPIGDPTGPIENGMTYIVRPRIDPLKSPLSVSRISAGSRPVFGGPGGSPKPGDPANGRAHAE